MGLMRELNVGRVARLERRSDRRHELVERSPYPLNPGSIDGDLVVPAAQVLDKCVPGDDDLRGPNVRRSEPVLEAAVNTVTWSTSSPPATPAWSST
jgi:hypothetical protein